MSGTHETGQLRIPLEDQLLLSWRELLGSPEAGPEDNFFECGGTSLVAARLASRLAAQLQCRVTAADILSHPSVRSLARKLSGKEAALNRSASDQRAAMQRNAFAMRKPERAIR
jgi:hypothetical protein